MQGVLINLAAFHLTCLKPGIPGSPMAYFQDTMQWDVTDQASVEPSPSKPFANYETGPLKLQNWVVGIVSWCHCSADQDFRHQNMFDAAVTVSMFQDYLLSILSIKILVILGTMFNFMVNTGMARQVPCPVQQIPRLFPIHWGFA